MCVFVCERKNEIDRERDGQEERKKDKETST